MKTATYQACRFVGGPRDGELWLPTSRNWRDEFTYVQFTGSRAWHHYERVPGGDWIYQGIVKKQTHDWAEAT